MPAEQPHFTFTISSLDPGTFHVVRFTGTEGLSRLYQFELTLLAGKAPLDFHTALSGTATFTVKRPEGGDLTWHGILRDIRLTRTAGDHTFYRAVLVPKAWLLTQTQHNRIFLNQDLIQNLRDCLTDGGLMQGLDFEIHATQSYPKREYVCQYNETHMNFVSRWTERNGLYFFFDQSGPQEKLILTDSLSIHTPHPGGAGVSFAEVSGLDADIAGTAVKNFQCEQRRLPHDVLVRDYNYRTPNLDIQGRAVVSEHGTGTVYAHGGHMRSMRQAGFLAGIRAQSLGCREQVFFGESNAPYLQPGYLARLDSHPREDFNRSYLMIEVKHEGAQESFITSGLGVVGAGDRLFYRNAFAAIPESVQFRAEIKTPRPVVEGVLMALVDAEGSGKYAELDDQGRYKVIMPFDLSGRKDGHASTWLRMVQPYAGDNHGMHFPLHKGTEVIVSFYEGDPDRPMIAGALPNLQTPSVVTADNQTMANITTSGGNRIHMEDREGSERILLHSSAKGEFIRIGAPNDPGEGGSTSPPSMGSAPASNAAPTKASGAEPSPTSMAAFKAAGGGISLYTPQALTVKAGFYNSLILGDNTSTTIGVGMSNYIGGLQKTTVGFSTEFKCAAHTEFAPLWEEMRGSVRETNAMKTKIAGELAETVANHTVVIARRTKAIANLTETVADQSRMVGTLTKVVVEHSKTIGEVQETVGKNTRTIGEIEDIIGEIDTFAAHLIQTLGQHDINVGQMNQISGDTTVTSGDLNVTSADATHTNASTQTITGEFTVI
ncbi:MAG: Rhs element Vgr [Desulfovibrionaceae bacterium]|nr:MAG: Rhs element Vgr [Desulfovibrionaceae bacterium]